MINILLAEDNAINQFVAVKMLRRWGMEVMIANNGQEALMLIQSKSFHLILMDLEMPVMDGYESTRRIREMEGMYFKTIPIIAFSASEIIDARRKAIDSGMTDFIAKPLHQEELQCTIDKYVSKNMKNEYGVRPLNIDFDQYTDGDAEFKFELVSLIILDIGELKESLVKATLANDPEIFVKACHKTKTTVGMVNDVELTLLLEGLKAQMGLPNTNWRTVFGAEILLFHQHVEGLLKSLSSLHQFQDQSSKV